MLTGKLTAILILALLVSVVVWASGPPGPPPAGPPIPVVNPNGGGGGGGGGGQTGSGIGGTVANQCGATDGICNVVNWGAVDDGVTDSTTAIQNAVYAAIGGTGCTVTPPKPIFFAHAKTGHYLISQPIHEPCQNVEMYASDEGTGLAPNYVGPSVLVEPYGQENLTQGPQLIGTGYSVVSTPGAGVFGIAPSEIINSLTLSMNGAAALDIEVGFEQTSTWATGASFNTIFSSRDPQALGQNGNPSFATISVPGIGNAYLQATVALSSGQCNLTSSTTPSLNVAHDAAVDCTGTTCRLFLDGTIVATSSCSGTVVQGPFEVVQIPGMGGPGYWPYGASQSESVQGYIGPLRIEKASLHTSNYTPATLTADANTAFLTNFPASPDGVQSATSSAFNNQTIYMAVHLKNVGTQLPHVHIHNMYLGTNLDVTWSWQSEFDHLSVASVNGFYGVANFNANDFETSVHDNTWIGPSSIGINYGGGFVEAAAHDNQGGTAVVGFNADSASLTDTHSVVEGSNIYKYLWVVDGGHVNLKFPFEDMEGTTTAFLGSFFFKSNNMPSTILGGELSTYNGAPYVWINGGNGPIFTGTEFGAFAQNQPASQVVDIVSNAPTSPVVLNAPQIPSNVPLTTAANAGYVVTGNVLNNGLNEERVSSLQILQTPVPTTTATPTYGSEFTFLDKNGDILAMPVRVVATPTPTPSATPT